MMSYCSDRTVTKTGGRGLSPGHLPKERQSQTSESKPEAQALEAAEAAAVPVGGGLPALGTACSPEPHQGSLENLGQTWSLHLGKSEPG